MSDFVQKVQALSPAKALALGVYGESVAAYRYRTLRDKAAGEKRRALFAEMAEEEHGHQVLLQDLLKKHFPGSDFVLSAEDREMVIVGPRMLDISHAEAFEQALKTICESERLTGRFYDAIAQTFPIHEMQPLLKAMAAECFEHAERLESAPPPE